MKHIIPRPSSKPFYLFLLIPLICASANIQAQTFTLKDTINQVATAILDVNHAGNYVTVQDPSVFQENDRVLLIKMQGAAIEESNDSGFGTIGNTNGVGLYEIATICSILGNNVIFQYHMVNDYAPLGTFSGKMQMIKIPQYAGNVNVSGALTAPAWNGNTGGVLIFEATGTITLNGDIDMSGKGFRGGHLLNSNYVCIPSMDGDNADENSVLAYYSLSSGEGGCKGEGIAEYIPLKETGKGNQANGGGGGNNHNAGGGGGGNYGIGGSGGTRQATTTAPIPICRGNHPGEPGTLLAGLGYAPTNNRIFMGGGGGAGHADDGGGQLGGNGGGIVILIGNSLNGNFHSIRANGQDALPAGDDGGPGGGAGGVILIDVNTVSSRPFTLEARGGAGGGASHAGNDCNGPGGGGGGGVIWTRNPLGTIATTDVTGGMFGLTAATSGCPGGGGITRNGSSSGHDGVVLNGLNIPEETVNLNTCVLEAAAAELEASVRNGYVELYWQSMGELFNDTFVIERSKDGKLFERLETLAAEGGQAHEWADLNPLAGRSYYRIKLQDRQGAFIYSNQVEVQVQRPNFFSMKVFPNPANNNETLSLQTELPEGRKLQIVMTDMLGKRVLQQYLEVEAGKQTHSLELPALGPGTYILQAQAGKYISQAKIVII